MLVGGSHDTKLIAQFKTILNGSFPLAWSHIMQIGVVSLIAFCQTVTGIHFYEWSNISFGKAFPVVTAITTLITHVVRGNEYFMSFCFFFPVLD